MSNDKMTQHWQDKQEIIELSYLYSRACDRLDRALLHPIGRRGVVRRLVRTRRNHRQDAERRRELLHPVPQIPSRRDLNGRSAHGVDGADSGG